MDLTHTHGYWRSNRDPNLFYDPVTGYNRPVSSRPDLKFTSIQWMESKGENRRLALSSSLTRRLQRNFQGSVTYTLMFYDESTSTRTTRSTLRAAVRADGRLSAPHAPFQRDLPPAADQDATLRGVFLRLGQSGGDQRRRRQPVRQDGDEPVEHRRADRHPESLADRWTGPMVIGTNETVGRNALLGLPLHKWTSASQDVMFGAASRSPPRRRSSTCSTTPTTAPTSDRWISQHWAGRSRTLAMHIIAGGAVRLPPGF
jgi:hypothetical protein